ncbi:MAG: dnaX [Candidatus Saccharibacteria bacterium]|nr:dnaX [Candidatus Saccharibacteria bacterium]
MNKNGDTSSAPTALYRKYRSRSFDEVISQSQVTNVLRRSIQQGKVAHAYLLTGPKGVGKTSIARILAHEINGLPYDGEDSHLDIIEIDAASNNGVDDVRDLRDKVQLAPAVASKKVYIIDEVHMLSKPAFNALLKTLEEPPAHVVFILATTDLHKVPVTIISRTQHFALHAISPKDLAGQLKKIAESEKMKVTDEALDAIAARGDGSFRNSISLLDQMSSFADEKDGITLDLVQSTLGLAPTEAITTLLQYVANRDVAGVISQLDTLEQEGIQPTVLADQIIVAIRKQLADQPHTVTLLDSLLSVAGSSQPQLKLLTVLVGAIKPKASAAARVNVAPVAVIEAPLPPVKSASATKPVKKHEKTDEEIIIIEEVAAPKPQKKSSPSKDIDWSQLIDHAKQNFVALHSVLSKCTYHFDGKTLTIYAVRKFNKTKLDQSKYQSQLFEALATIGVSDITLDVIPTTEPPADEQLAKIAAMMGGGQEVPLTEAGETA